MAINLKTEEGFEFSFDTVEELMEFTQRMNAVTESTSDEGPAEDENEVPETEPKFEVGDKVRVVVNTSGGHNEGTIGEISGVRYIGSQDLWSYAVDPISGYQKNYRQHHEESDLELSEMSDDGLEVGDKVRVVSADDGTNTPYHYHDDGSVGIVIGKQELGRIEVEVDGKEQYLLPHHYEKVESLGKDANGEDLYKGDFVTGTEGNGYGNTNDKVVMEVLGDGESYFSEKANIKVKIVGYCTEYNVDSTRFIKLSDNLDEAKEKFDEIKGEGEERMITSVDSEEPKYNLSGVGIGVWVDNSDIEHVDSSPKFQTGDIVRVTESFEDDFGDRVTCGAVYNYDENLGFGEPFVGSVFLGDNIDKIELVCRAQDRLDK